MNILIAACMSVMMLATSPDNHYAFTLRNNSAVSIPLHIPDVMNPNLSPFSNSSVDLKEGQEIFFYDHKKKYILLTVTPELAGQTLIVNELIKERRAALNLDKE